MRTELTPVLEIGGTHVTAALVRRSDWTLERRVRLDVDAAADADSILERFATAGSSLDVDGGAAWGIAMPDPFDYEAGVALFDGVGKYEALFGVDVGAALRERVGAASVRFVNDADAFVLGRGLRPALQACRPDVVGIGGSMSASWQLVVDDYLRGLDWPDAPPHRVAADTEAAALRGAAAYLATG